MKHSKCLLRPPRLLMIHGESDRSLMLYAESDTPNNLWKVKEVNEKDSFLIANGLNPIQSNALFEITLLYISDVSSEALADIIYDEQDLLAGFRVALKKVLTGSVDSEHDNINILNEINEDVLRPELEKISRKFKHYTDVLKLSVGGTVTAFTLSLICVYSGPNFNFQSLVQPLLMGGAPFGLLASELAYRKNQDKLRDNPYYLLWKLSYQQN